MSNLSPDMSFSCHSYFSPNLPSTTIQHIVAFDIDNEDFNDIVVCISRAILLSLPNTSGLAVHSKACGDTCKGSVQKRLRDYSVLCDWICDESTFAVRGQNFPAVKWALCVCSHELLLLAAFAVVLCCMLFRTGAMYNRLSVRWRSQSGSFR